MNLWDDLIETTTNSKDKTNNERKIFKLNEMKMEYKKTNYTFQGKN